MNVSSRSLKIIKNPWRFSKVMITNVLPAVLWFTVYETGVSDSVGVCDAGLHNGRL